MLAMSQTGDYLLPLFFDFVLQIALEGALTALLETKSQIQYIQAICILLHTMLPNEKQLEFMGVLS